MFGRKRTTASARVMRRASMLSMDELLTWADNAVMSTGANVDLFRRDGDPSYVAEAMLCNDVLRVILNEIAVRSGAPSALVPEEWASS